MNLKEAVRLKAIMELSAIYNCGRQDDAAVVEVLARFRQHYPMTRLMLINDGGSNILESYAKLFHCEYSLCSRVSSVDSGFQLSEACSAVTYMERILNCIPEDDCWVLLLEDDTWVCDQVPLTDLKYDMCGRSARTLPVCLTLAIQQKFPTFPLKRVECADSGGAFLRGSFMRKMRENNVWRRNVAIMFSMMEPISSSHLLSVLVYMDGGTIGPYKGYGEPSFLFYKLYSILGKQETVFKILGKQKKKFWKPNQTE